MKKGIFGFITMVLVVGLVVMGGSWEARAAGENKYGGIAKFSWTSQSNRIGVPLNLRGPAWVHASYFLQPLLSSTDKMGVYEPLLATSWELAPDKSSYIFNLRKGVKFHDGTPFNAQAAKWNLDNVLASKAPYLQNVKSIDLLDDYTIRLNLKKWDALILDDIRNPICFMISPTAYETKGEKWCDTHPVGTGPFKIKKFERDVVVSGEKFEDYWEKGKPYLDGFEFLQIKDHMTSMAALLSGEIHMLREVQPEIAVQIKKTGKFLFENMYAGQMVLYLDNANPKSLWYDKRMREALEYAVNKAEICESLGFGYFRPSYEVILGIHEACNPGTTPRTYDIEKAKKLLSEAGHPGGNIKVALNTNNKFYDDFVVALQEDLAAVGITMEINRKTQAAMEELRFNPFRNSDFQYDRPHGGVADMLPFVKQELSSDTIYHPGTMRPEGWDALLDQAMTEVDPEKRLGIVEEMERGAYRDLVCIPLWHRPVIHAYTPKLKSDRKPMFHVAGIPINGWLWKDMWLEK